MMHVHGVRAQGADVTDAWGGAGPVGRGAVYVGKSTAMAMAVDFSGRRLAAPIEFALHRVGVERFVGRVRAVVPAGAVLVRVGVEACGHYHRPLVASGVLPAGWQLVELNPAWVPA